MTALPLVSVIVPVYNGRRFIADALDTVLAQSYPHIEVLVVDDGSSDASGTIVQGYPDVLYHQQARQGVAAARNAGVRRARGTVLAFIDQDDLWTLEKTSEQVAYLLEQPAAAVVSCHTQFFLDGIESKPGWLRQGRFEAPGKNFTLGGCLIWRSVFESVGWFDTVYVSASDHDWFVRALDAGFQIDHMNAVLLKRRVHQHNQSQETASTHELIAIHRASINRKRDQQACPSR